MPFAEFPIHRTLDDAEVELGLAGGGGLVLVDPVAAAMRPAQGEIEAFSSVARLAGVGSALIEEHGDV
jgi:hypothetical protein